MPNKVLFLDFDGVLHPTTHGTVLLSQLPLLESALESCDYTMVISSSWRFHMEMEDLKKHFSSSVRNKIVGATGDAYIGAYALDDSYWEFPQDCGQLIRCNPNSGLTQREVKVLSEWLSQE